MLLTSFDPFVHEFDQLARRVFGQWEGPVASRGIMPMDAVRHDDEVLLRFDIPGADPDSIDVTVDRGVLSVSARRAGEYGEGEHPFIRERVSGAFTRRLHLDDTLDADKVEATYTDGVLTVRVPLAEQAKPRKVEIKTAGKKALKG